MDFKKVSDLLKVIALLIGRVIIGTQNILTSESSQCLSLIEHLWEGRERQSVQGQKAVWQGDGIIMVILIQIASVYLVPTLCISSHMCHILNLLKEGRVIPVLQMGRERLREVEWPYSKLHIVRGERQLGLSGKVEPPEFHHQGHKLLMLFGGHVVGGKKGPQHHDSGIKHLGKQLRPKN